jgi:hypothetical protein
MPAPAGATTPSDLLDELLDDAKLVASYAQRTGRLRDQSLLRAIGTVEALPKRTWNDKAVIQLQSSLSSNVRAIAPTTLIELRKRNPFAKVPVERRRIGPFDANVYFVFASLLMMVTAAWYTLQYNVGAVATVELERIGQDHVKEEIGLVVRQILAADEKIVEANQGDPIEDGEPYFIMVETLRDFDTRVTKAHATATNFLIYSHNPFAIGWTMIAPFFSENYDKPYADCSYEGPAQASDPLVAASQQSSSALAAPQASAVTQVAALEMTAGEDTASGGNPDAGSGPRTSDAFETMYGQYRKEALHLLCLTGVRTTPFNLPPVEEQATNARNRINLLSLWFLPAVYGALGATIYYMRRILDPTLVDPSFHRVLHRIALGAFSGVIIAWFWSPSNRIYDDFSDVGLSLFGVAFIVGFSVEIFFNFLDRIVLLINGWIRQLGTSKATTK